MCKEFIQKLIFNTNFYGQNTVRFLPKKNNTGTETDRLVYNKIKFENKLCQ